MNPIDRLIEAHPRLFRSQAARESSYLPEGWYALVDKLRVDIEQMLGSEGELEVVQVKPKFGVLRFYCGRARHLSEESGERVLKLVLQAQEASESTCQECGAAGETRDVAGVYATLCEAHLEQRQRERAAEATEAADAAVMKATRTRYTLDDVDIEVEVDPKRQVVTVHMLEFEADQLVEFLLDELPWCGVRVDEPAESESPAESDSDFAEPRFALVVALAGRHHPARLLTYGTGRDVRGSLRLGDPDAAYLAKCQEAIEQLLPALHQRGIEAVVARIDRYGRPEPSEGFLHLCARMDEDGQEDYVQKLRREVEKAHDVSIAVFKLWRLHGFTDRVAYEPHFAWDAAEQQVVRRNWSPL